MPQYSGTLTRYRMSQESYGCCRCRHPVNAPKVVSVHDSLRNPAIVTPDNVLLTILLHIHLIAFTLY
jgi:hypothetical protein